MNLLQRLFVPILAPIIASALAVAALLAPVSASASASASASTSARQHHPTPQPMEVVPATRVAAPALWKVADADTTIYLFGTIHMLPAGIDWYHGKVVEAFASATELVTEIPEGSDGQVPALVIQHGILTDGQSLRGMMSPAERRKFEAAMNGLGLPVGVFDRYKPWYAAVALATLPLTREGYDPARGVEAELADRNKAQGRPRIGLETLTFQLSLFDQFPLNVQKQYLFEVVDALPGLKGDIAAMITAWARGDAAKLAELMNSEEDNPAMRAALITDRNRNWAAWVRKRLDQPGVVFIAVGAGHLGGVGSVQDQLAGAGIKAERVQ